MRIRKNAKLIFSSSTSYQQTRPTPHVCKLNQSPWDAIPPTRKTSNSASSYATHTQLRHGGAEDLSGNGGIGDSIPALESIASMVEENVMKSHDNIIQCVTNPSCRKSDNLLLPRRRGRGPGKKASKSNPNEFDYYSGFGPLWEKKREHINVENNNQMEEAELAGLIEDGGDSGGEGGDSGIDGGDNGRKRGRKPVKARSLKSLM